MGYRSDVVLVMYAMDKKDYPALQVWFSQFEQENNTWRSAWQLYIDTIYKSGE